MSQGSRNFYLYLSFHSFLIGLFPFYIPVYLWKLGYQLSDISLFIALTGFAFCGTLWVWDRLRLVVSLKTMIIVSFLVEIIFLSIIFTKYSPSIFYLLAVLNGIYNCLFWTLNRVLFFETLTSKDSGRKYGNLQIIVTLFLKTGIFIGGLLLEYFDYSYVYLLSLFVAIVASSVFLRRTTILHQPEQLTELKPLSFRAILTFKMNNRSGLVFIFDGWFLFLESYFWIISVFLIVQESFWRLGIVVIVLAILFGALFYLFKNRIDVLPKDAVYNVCVGLYAFSWFLRSVIDQDFSLLLLLGLMILITFFTTLFRLSFNKRFFDIAKGSVNYAYLIQKSYFSQFFIGIFFGVSALVYQIADLADYYLSSTYIFAGVVAFIYLFYKLETTIPNMKTDLRNRK